MKMQKQLKSNNLYYLVCNDKKKYNDWFIFDKYKDMPILERYFFSIFANELTDNFDVNYSSSRYKALLLITHNICFDGDKIDIKTSNELQDIYFSIRYEDMPIEIEYFRNKYEPSSIKKYLNYVIAPEHAHLSSKVKTKIQELSQKIGKNINAKDLTKEILFLCSYVECERALKRAKKTSTVFKAVEDAVADIEFDEF